MTYFTSFLKRLGTPLDEWSRDVSGGQRSPITTNAKTVAGLPGCVLEDMAQYHDVECGCVYCVELRGRRGRGQGQGQANDVVDPDERCGGCGNPKSCHRAALFAHHSECTLEDFRVGTENQVQEQEQETNDVGTKT